MVIDSLLPLLPELPLLRNEVLEEFMEDSAKRREEGMVPPVASPMNKPSIALMMVRHDMMGIVLGLMPGTSSFNPLSPAWRMRMLLLRIT